MRLGSGVFERVIRMARGARWSVRLGLGCVGLAVGILVSAGPVGASDPASSVVKQRAAANQQNDAADFPLWVTVPSKRFAVLGKGVVRQRYWGVFAYRGRGQEGASHPCLHIASAYAGNAPGSDVMLQSGSNCGSLGPPSDAPLTKVSGFSVQRSLGSPLVSGSVLAFGFGTSIVRATIRMSDGFQRTLRTTLLNQGQAAKARVHPFRYLAFSVARKVCIVRVEGFDAAGRLSLSSPEADCP